jgi:hypothetical protein
MIKVLIAQPARCAFRVKAHLAQNPLAAHLAAYQLICPLLLWSQLSLNTYHRDLITSGEETRQYYQLRTRPIHALSNNAIAVRKIKIPGVNQNL